MTTTEPDGKDGKLCAFLIVCECEGLIHKIDGDCPVALMINAMDDLISQGVIPSRIRHEAYPEGKPFEVDLIVAFQPPHPLLEDSAFPEIPKTKGFRATCECEGAHDGENEDCPQWIILNTFLTLQHIGAVREEHLSDVVLLEMDSGLPFNDDEDRYLANSKR